MIRLLAVSLVVSIGVEANSRGIGIPCSIDSSMFGSPGRDKDIPGKVMWWVLPPAWANNRYTLRTADTPLSSKANDPASYEPGKWTELYLRTNEQDKQFTGLVMFAENQVGKQVGEWFVYPNTPYQVSSANCVFHSNADPKNYLSKFRFRAPEGTGPITIKALVKFGLAFPAMDGVFLWPNTEHLLLNEVAAVVPVWHQGELGESCTTVCNNAMMDCDLDAMVEKNNDPAGLYQLVMATSECTPPLLLGCSGASPAVGIAGCFYHDPTCTRRPPPTPFVAPDPCEGVPAYDRNTKILKGECVTYATNNGNDPLMKWCTRQEINGYDPKLNDNAWEGDPTECGVPPTEAPPPTFAPRLPESLSCDAKKSTEKDGKRLCACKGKPGGDISPGGLSPTTSSSGSPTDGAPGGGGTWLTSGAGRLSNCVSSYWSSMLLLLLLLVNPFANGYALLRYSFQSRATKVIVVGLVCLSVLPSSEAHNWLTSPARANGGGLGSFNGFSSPPCPQKGSRVHAQVARGQKFMLEWTAGHPQPGIDGFTYLALVKAADERHLKKHSIKVFDEYFQDAPASSLVTGEDWKSRHMGGGGEIAEKQDMEYSRPDIFWASTGSAFIKTDEAAKDDMRAVYTHPKYSWIISLHRFRIHSDGQDMCYFEVPAGAEPGMYVVQYLWSGYYDCMDVNVIADQSTDIWGSKQKEVQFDRIDHCAFQPGLPNYNVKSDACFELQPKESPEKCTTLCAPPCEGQQCEQQQGQQQEDPNACNAVQVSPVFLDKAAKFPGLHQGGQSHLPAVCGTPSSTATVETQYCYTLRSGDTPLVGPNYKVVSDPEDPIFYSTCYVKKAGWSFAQEAPANDGGDGGSANFMFGDKCIACQYAETNKAQQPVPIWMTEDTCEHCDPTLG